MKDAKPCHSPMATRTKLFTQDNEPYSDPTQYKSTIGALQYLTLTKLDLVFVVNRLSQFSKALSVLQ